jgi:hypothetical protein
VADDKQAASEDVSILKVDITNYEKDEECQKKIPAPI